VICLPLTAINPDALKTMQTLTQTDFPRARRQTDNFTLGEICFGKRRVALLTMDETIQKIDVNQGMLATIAVFIRPMSKTAAASWGATMPHLGRAAARRERRAGERPAGSQEGRYRSRGQVPGWWFALGRRHLGGRRSAGDLRVTLEEVKRLPIRKPVGKYNVHNKITRSEGMSH
jgi:hypothetical protein